MNTNIDNCIKWLKTKCDISFLTNAKIEEIVSLVIQWDVNNAIKIAKQRQEQEEKRKKEEAEREDYREETDENGRVWFEKTHLYPQREKSRKLKPGDIIKYTAYQGDFIENGIMIVNSFDCESDFVARSYIQVATWTKEKDVNYKHKFVAGGLAPGIDKFSFATEDEIKNFFTYIKEKEFEKYLFYFAGDREYIPDFIKKEKRYAKYI